MAAEIGTMRVTDQIDALDTLSTRPMQYLVAPRIMAGTLCLPFLVLIGDIIGVFGGYIVGVYRLGFNPSVYLSRTLEYLEFSEITLGLVKAAVFGFLIALWGAIMAIIRDAVPKVLAEPQQMRLFLRRS